MHLKSTAAIVALGTLTFSATAEAQRRPALADARVASHIALDTYATALDGELNIIGCAFKGKHSAACRTEIVGPVHQYHRVLVSMGPARAASAQRTMFVVRVRPIAAPARRQSGLRSFHY